MFRATWNNITYITQKVPTLATALTVGKDATDPRVYGVNANPFVLKHNNIIELVINNIDGGAHPIRKCLVQSTPSNTLLTMPRYAWPRNAARCSRSWCLRPRPQAQGRPCSHRIQRRYIRLPRDPNEARHNDGCTSRLHRHAIQGRQPGRLDYALPHGVAYHRRAYGYIHRGPDSASVTEHLCPILGKLQGAGCAHGRQRGREHEEPLRSSRGEHSASAAEPERVSKSHLLASSRGFPADMTPAVPFTLEMVFDPICLIVFSPLLVLWES